MDIRVVFRGGSHVSTCIFLSLHIDLPLYVDVGISRRYCGASNHLAGAKTPHMHNALFDFTRRRGAMHEREREEEG